MNQTAGPGTISTLMAIHNPRSDASPREGYTAATELRKSEEHLRRLAEIVESTDDAIISTDLSTIISTWNKGAERLYGYTAEEIIGRPIRVLVPPDRLEEEAAILGRIRRGERIEARDTVRKRKDGSLVDVLLTVSLLKNAAGEVVGGCSIVRDITDRKRLEKDVELLSRELDHRARNLLGVVHAIVSLSSAPTLESLKAVIEGRVHALAKAHTLLSEARWTGADLASLIKQELSPYCLGQDARGVVNGPDTHLEIGQAQPFALLFHELTTNSVKYGALSAPTGTVAVLWARGNGAALSINWLERGGPPVERPKARGFGMRVIEEVVGRQLHGQVLFDWAPSGLSCSIELPRFFGRSTSGKDQE
jgi:PAS domain S-box-containing protein